jgi:hypothetical protein
MFMKIGMEMWLVVVVPLYQGKRGARTSSLVTSCTSATGIRTGKQSECYRRGRVIRGRINWKTEHTREVPMSVIYLRTDEEVGSV